jgi:hypothetical protein
LGLTEFRNSTTNNIVSGMGALKLEGNSIWLDEIAPAEERYKCVAKSIAALPRAPEGSGLVLSISADGLRWRTKAVWLLHPTHDDDTQSVIRWDGQMRRYQLYTRRWIRPPQPWRRMDSFRTVRRLTTTNPLSNLSVWLGKPACNPRSDPLHCDEIVMAPDSVDDATHPHACEHAANGSVVGPSCAPPLDYYGGTVWAPPTAANGTLLMLTQRTWHWSAPPSLPALTHQQADWAKLRKDVGLAVSRDGGGTFERVGGRDALIGLGGDGGPSSGRVWAIPSPIPLGGEWLLYYVAQQSNVRDAVVLSFWSRLPPSR